MATLAEQLEENLQGLGATITPGVLSAPTAQAGQLNWSDIFTRISEGKPLQPGEGLPSIPSGVTSNQFYREAARLGALPAGAATGFAAPLRYNTRPTTTPSTGFITPTATTRSYAPYSTGTGFYGGQYAADTRGGPTGESGSGLTDRTGQGQVSVDYGGIRGAIGPTTPGPTKEGVAGMYTVGDFVDVADPAHWSDFASDFMTAFSPAGPTSINPEGKIANLSTMRRGAYGLVGTLAGAGPFSSVFGTIINDMLHGNGSSQIGRVGLSNQAMTPTWDAAKGRWVGGNDRVGVSIAGFTKNGVAIDMFGDPVLDADGTGIFSGMPTHGISWGDYDQRAVDLANDLFTGPALTADNATLGWGKVGTPKEMYARMFGYLFNNPEHSLSPFSAKNKTVDYANMINRAKEFSKIAAKQIDPAKKKAAEMASDRMSNRAKETEYSVEFSHPGFGPSYTVDPETGTVTLVDTPVERALARTRAPAPKSAKERLDQDNYKNMLDQIAEEAQKAPSIDKLTADVLSRGDTMSSPTTGKTSRGPTALEGPEATRGGVGTGSGTRGSTPSGGDTPDSPYSDPDKGGGGTGPSGGSDAGDSTGGDFSGGGGWE